LTSHLRLSSPVRLSLQCGLALLSVLAACAPACRAAAPLVRAAAPLVIEGVGRAAIPMDGPWQFHPGDDSAWSSPAFDDSSWNSIQAGRPWEGQGYRNLTGFAWYRLHIVLPANLAPGWSLAISLAGVQDAAEVYWNGRLIGSYGKVPPNPVWAGNDFFPPVVMAVPGTPQPGEAVVAIRVWKAPYAYLAFSDMGGLAKFPILGDTEALRTASTGLEYQWLRSHIYSMAIALLSGIVSLLALLGWLRDRRQWMLFWLAAYTIRPFLLLLFEQWPNLSWRVSYGSVGMVYSATDAALWFLLLYLLGLRENPRLVQWTRICAVIAFGSQIFEGAEQLFDWTQAPRFFLLADVGLTIPSLLLQVWAIVLVVVAFRKRLDPARWLVALFAMLADVVSNSQSWFNLGNRWTGWTFADKITTPLFTIAGNRFDALTILNTLLLVSIVYAVWRYEMEQRRLQTRLSEEFRNAQEVQRILIPEEFPTLPGIAVTSAYRPAQEVGGDFFQIIPLPGGGALLVVGDVSGKGLHAAMTVALLVGAIRSAVEVTTEPAEILSGLNRRLHGRLRHGFATCLVIRLDGHGGCILANAGHPPPYLNAQEVQLPSALPLGLLDAVQYDSVDLRLGPGDHLVLYTDGLLEARNAAGELFGFSRIGELLTRTQDARQIAETAQQFGQDDDITVLTLSFAPVRAQVA
jgi:Stage II sporulation protein E (SpoIIE)